MKKMFAILTLFSLFIWSSLHIQARIECYQLEVQRMQLEVEMLRLEQQELTKQVREFLNKWNVEEFEVTAYSPFDDKNGLNSDGNPCITSTGTRPGPGTVAVNPSVIPYGSRLWIQGYGWGRALDTGGMIRARNDLIDVYKDTYKQAMAWGRRKVVVVWSNQLQNKY